MMPRAIIFYTETNMFTAFYIFILARICYVFMYFHPKFYCTKASTRHLRCVSIYVYARASSGLEIHDEIFHFEIFRHFRNFFNV